MTFWSYMIAFTSRDIGQYVYYNCLITRLGHHKIWNKLIFLIKPFRSMTKKSRQKLNILSRKRAFEVKWKAFSIIFKGLSVAKNCLKPESAPLRVLKYYEQWARQFFALVRLRKKWQFLYHAKKGRDSEMVGIRPPWTHL